MSASEVAPLTLPPITEQSLPNGLSVVTVEQHSLPLTTVRLMVSAGSMHDPKAKEGLATLTSHVLRRGTRTRTATEVDTAIESVGGMLGVDASIEATFLAATLPSEHTATAVDIIADLARHPSFPKPEFDLAQRRALAQLQQELDEPSGMTDRALVRFFYGPSHPYGRPSEGRLKTVGRLSRSDAVSFHKGSFSPVNATLIFGGDITPDAARQIASDALADWKGTSRKSVDVPAVDAPERLEVLLVDKPDATQAQIRIAVPGIRRADPAYYALQLANSVVGGSFTSRLVDEVRVNRGLSYSVGTRVVAARELGAITFSSFTKTETVRELIDVVFNVLQRFHDEGPSQDELDRAKRHEIGLYPGRVESVEQLAGALAHLRLLDMPFTTISEHRARLAAVTLADALDAARRFPTQSNAKVVVLGKASAIRSQLQGLGALSELRLTELE